MRVPERSQRRKRSPPYFHRRKSNFYKLSRFLGGGLPLSLSLLCLSVPPFSACRLSLSPSVYVSPSLSLPLGLLLSLSLSLSSLPLSRSPSLSFSLSLCHS